MTVKRRALDIWIERRCREDHEVYQLCVDYLEGLREGFWEQPYVDMIMQYHRKPSYDFGDAYVFGQIHAAFHLGKLELLESKIGEAPVADAMIDENNRRLKKLSGPFHAEFTGGLADCDGALSLNKSLGDDSIPLEVGCTDAATTLNHLFYREGLARWPYESDIMFIICATGKGAWGGAHGYLAAALEAVEK